jgi:O-methyltransferase domain
MNDMSTAEAKWLANYVSFAPMVFQVAHCMKKFGIFKMLMENPEGLELGTLSRSTGLSEYSTSVLVDAAMSSKFVDWASPGDRNGQAPMSQRKIVITNVGQFLENDKICHINLNFSKDVCYQGMDSLEQSLRTQSPTGLKVFGNWKTIYAGLTQLPEQTQKSWFEFDHFYSDESFPRILPEVFKSNPKKIMDIGTNTGKFAIQCLKFSSEVRLTLVDHPSQLKIAQKNVESNGFAGRVDYVPMNMLDHSLALPKGQDLIWMSQFLDCFSSEEIVSILRRCRSAMSETTELFIMETFTDCQHFDAAKFCLDMTSLYFTNLANGNSRMYRSTDFKEFLRAAELRLVEQTDKIRLSHSLIKAMV